METVKQCFYCRRVGVRGFIIGEFDEAGNFHDLTRCENYNSCVERIIFIQKIISRLVAESKGRK